MLAITHGVIGQACAKYGAGFFMRVNFEENNHG
jgi:hypothetical protein